MEGLNFLGKHTPWILMKNLNYDHMTEKRKKKS